MDWGSIDYALNMFKVALIKGIHGPRKAGLKSFFFLVDQPHCDRRVDKEEFITNYVGQFTYSLVTQTKIVKIFISQPQRFFLNCWFDIKIKNMWNCTTFKLHKSYSFSDHIIHLKIFTKQEIRLNYKFLNIAIKSIMFLCYVKN